jgi:hypothetical protein
VLRTKQVVFDRYTYWVFSYTDTMRCAAWWTNFTHYFFCVSSIFYEVAESMCCSFYHHCSLTELGYVVSNRVLHDIQCRRHQFQLVPVLFQLLVVFWRRLVSDYMLLLCLNSYHAVKKNLTTSIASLRARFTMGQEGKLILQWPKSVFRNSVRLMAWFLRFYVVGRKVLIIEVPRNISQNYGLKK